MQTQRRHKEKQSTLVVTQWNSPFLIVTWQSAILLLLREAVELVEAYDGEIVRSPSIALPLPAVVRLRRATFAGVRRGVRCNRENVLLRDRYVCQYCGEKKPGRDLNLDHVVPASRGGARVWENIVTACIRCNSTKRDRTPGEAGMRLLSKPVRPWTLPLAAIEREDVDVPAEWVAYSGRASGVVAGG